MPFEQVESPFFIPAATETEAHERIFALTGCKRPSRTPGGSRAGKAALVALRDALNLDVDIVWTGASMGRTLAVELGVEWRPDVYTVKNMVTLDGFNALLEAASRAAASGSLARLRDDVPDTLSGPGWDAFIPARSKIEAVTRIAALTDAPREWLGPGSKEHKSVFVNLADALFPDDPRVNKTSKTKLGASLAEVLGVGWSDQCASTGETIQLPGLNTILAGAERRLGVLGTEITDALHAPEAEGDALAAALKARLRRYWDGRRSVEWLARQGKRGSNDNEWQGFFGEELAKEILFADFTPRVDGPRVRYGNTTFDYALNWVWDIKVHTEVQAYTDRRAAGKNEMLLNDERATRDCVDEQGLGFLVISGEAEMDESGEFVEWHRGFKARKTGKKAAPSNSGNSRARKSAFTPLHVETFWVANTLALDAAFLAGALKVKPIGRQAPREEGGEGAARADKIEMNIRHARNAIRIARHDFPPLSERELARLKA